jgi:hypothetical protein
VVTIKHYKEKTKCGRTRKCLDKIEEICGSLPFENSTEDFIMICFLLEVDMVCLFDMVIDAEDEFRETANIILGEVHKDPKLVVVNVLNLKRLVKRKTKLKLL